MKVEKLNLKCVNCGKESEQEVVYSSHTFGGKQHLDTRFDNGEVNAPIQECPHCHYANIDISKPSKNAKQVYESAKYQEILNSNLDKKIKNYLKAALVNEKDKDRSTAQLYLNASWCFEDEEDNKNATKYRRLACKHLIKIAQTEDNGDIYLQCIDLYRKNKDFDKAKEFLAKVKNELDNTDEEYKSMDEFVLISNIVRFEEILIESRDSDDHLLEESKVRMSFASFNSLFLRYSKMNNLEVSIYAPIVFRMKNDYFEAVVDYLKTGNKTNLIYGEYSTDKIAQGYWTTKPDYIKTVVILNNIKQFGDEGCYIFNPDIVE